MPDLLQHPALVAWKHACGVTDGVDAVFNPDTQSDQWSAGRNAADSLRHLFGVAIPSDVWEAHLADCERREQGGRGNV